MKSPADGYTPLINTNARIQQALKDLSYHPLKDFVPIIPLTKQGMFSSQARRPVSSRSARLVARQANP
jgi:hypothetical protein